METEPEPNTGSSKDSSEEQLVMETELHVAEGSCKDPSEAQLVMETEPVFISTLKTSTGWNQVFLGKALHKVKWNPSGQIVGKGCPR